MHLALIRSLLLIVLGFLSSGGATTNENVSCLPADTNLDEVVSTARPLGGKGSKQVTVRDALNKLKARCKKGKLVAANGREVRFYRLIGCWGNPPADYQQQLAQQRIELQRLRKKYTVVEIPCAAGDPRQIQ